MWGLVKLFSDRRVSPWPGGRSQANDADFRLNFLSMTADDHRHEDLGLLRAIFFTRMRRSDVDMIETTPRTLHFGSPVGGAIHAT